MNTAVSPQRLLSRAEHYTKEVCMEHKQQPLLVRRAVQDAGIAVVEVFACCENIFQIEGFLEALQYCDGPVLLKTIKGGAEGELRIDRVTAAGSWQVGEQLLHVDGQRSYMTELLYGLYSSGGVDQVYAEAIPVAPVEGSYEVPISVAVSEGSVVAYNGGSEVYALRDELFAVSRETAALFGGSAQVWLTVDRVAGVLVAGVTVA